MKREPREPAVVVTSDPAAFLVGAAAGLIAGLVLGLCVGYGMRPRSIQCRAVEVTLTPGGCAARCAP